MKLFLASSLCFVSDIITKHIELSWKTVGCIWNAADDDGGKNAEWNQRDAQFFESQWAIILDIDLKEISNVGELMMQSDILFVWWWDILYLADLAREVQLVNYLLQFWEKWWIYCGTSAGSMLACNEVCYPHPWRNTQWLELIDVTIIPHWSSPSFDREYWDGFHRIYKHPKPYITLTDIDVMIVEDNQRTIQRSTQHTLQSILEFKWDFRSNIY